MSLENGKSKPDNVKARFTIWLLTLIRRTRIDYLRILKRQAILVNIDDIPEGEFVVSLDENKYRHSKTNFEFNDIKLEKAFSKLPTQKKKVLLALFLSEKSCEEIAKDFNCSLQNVYNLKTKALKKLRELIAELEE